ncbi:MAG: hypothetical protein D6E12_02695 [Desulfovibrio sp.]|nr:MAG: hypothetical protein D6E12_02695 [Desulfovibrio sp.]
MTQRIFILILALAGFFLVSASAHAGYEPDPVGYVQEIAGDVVAINTTNKVKRWNHQEECRALGIRGAVFAGDTLVTGYGAKVQIMFLDGSVLVLGAESELLINNLVYDYDRDQDNLLDMSAGAGVFRYISGGIVDRNPNGFQLDTPLGLIGIRGTQTLSVHGGGSNPNGEIAMQLARWFRDPENMSLEEKHAARGVLGNFLPALGNGRNNVTRETQAHVSGSDQTPVVYTHDATGGSVNIPVGTQVDVSNEGTGNPTPITDQTRDAGAGSRQNRNAEVPTSLQSTQGGSDNSGSTSSSSGSSGSSCP